MEQKEIIEGNKSIAEFVGMEIKMGDWNESFTGWYKTNGFLNVEYIQKENLIFHSSWDWLMPVIEKIESIKDEHHGYFGVYISSNKCSIQGTNFRSDELANPPIYLCESYGYTKLEAAWIAVIKFIKWYKN